MVKRILSLNFLKDSKTYFNSLHLKKCNKCNLEKTKEYFSKNRNTCKECRRKYLKEYQKNNKEELSKQRKEYRETNRDIIRAKRKIHYNNNKEEILENVKIYYKNNRNKIIKRVCKYGENKRKTNLIFRINKNISCIIRKDLLSNNRSKSNASCWNYLPFKQNELKSYLQSKYEYWMNDENYGVYNPTTWTDDPITWTWQIDHIIPKSFFKYESMEDDNFKRCWALENLRPYSAKQNIIDGATHIRHFQ